MFEENKKMYSEEELTFKKSFEVTIADTDMFGRLKMSGLINFLIQAAVGSADKLGFGLNYLKKENLIWVLSRFEVQIIEKFKQYDEVIVETWPKKIDGIFYIRDFFVWNKSGKLMAKAGSAWLAIDAVRKRPKIIEGIISEKFHALSHKISLEKTPEKLKFIKGGEEYEIQTTFFDLDVNKHVTASRYIDWIIDGFSIEFHEKNYPKSLVINFIKETKPNEKIKIFKNNLTDNSFHFEGINVASEKNAFRSKIEF